MVDSERYSQPELDAAVQVHRTHKSGSDKRQRREEFPQIFHLYDKDAKCILGTGSALHCQYTCTPGEVAWQVTQAVLLENPFPITAGDRPYMSAVFPLTTSAAERLNASPVISGGTLLDHMSNCGGRPWRAWVFQSAKAQSAAQLLAKVPAIITTHWNIARAVGVRPAAASSCNDEYAADDEIFEDEACTASASVQPVGPALHICDLGRRTLSAMRSQAGESCGFVGHRYQPAALLACLRLAASMKPQARLNDVVADAAEILFGSVTKPLQIELRSGQHQMPSEDVLRVARVRLDIMTILFERKLWLRFEYRRYISCDSSPQLGHNFLCVREDRVGIPRDENVGALFRAKYDLNQNFESRIMPLSTLGLGHAGLANKALAVANLFLMEAETAEEFHAKRMEVRAATADQGTEKGIVDETIHLLQQYKDDFPAGDMRSFLFPKAVGVHGHLHILYNGLQEAIMSLPGASLYFEQLRVMEAFLSDRQLRKRFQAQCLQGKSCLPLFDSYGRVHIDWRWEFLSAALDKLVPLFPHMQAYFEPGKMMDGDSGSVQRAIMTEIAAVLQSEHFLVYSEMLRVFGKTVEGKAKTLEVCWCHGDIFRHAARSRARKRRLMLAATGKEHCVYKGRMGPWWVAVGISELMRDIQQCTSPTLDELLNKSSSSVRAQILEEQVLLKQRLQEIYIQKMGVWKTIPWRVVGVFYGCQNGDVTTSRAILKDCLQQHDRAIDEGLGYRQHRVSQLLFQKGTACRRQLDDFEAGGSCLEDFPVAFKHIQEYSLMSLVERSIETVHAEIKRAGSTALAAKPAYICAKVREKRNLGLLQTNQDFRDMCEQMWLTRKLADHVLVLRYPQQQLAAMTNAEKMKRIYQCALSTQYMDTSEIRALREDWLLRTAHTRGIQTAVPWEWKACVQYFKCRLHPGHIYAIKRKLFDQAQLRDFDYACCPRPASIAISAVQGKTAEFDWGNPGSFVIFQIINAYPERRTVMTQAAVLPIPTLVTVSVCTLLASTPHKGTAIIYTDANELATIDLRALVADMRESMGSLFQWEPLAKNCVMKPMPARSSEDQLQIIDFGSISDSQRAGTSESMVTIQLDELGPCVAALTQINHLCAKKGQQRLPFAELRGVHVTTLRRLAHHGALLLSEDEFGETFIVLNHGAIGWSYAMTVGCPLQMCHVPSTEPALKRSKLDLVLALTMDGWRHSGDLPAAWEPGCHRRFCMNLRLPHSYFVALFCEQDIMQKGVDRILHGQSGQYYKMLLTLDGDSLKQALANLPEQAERPAVFQMSFDDAIMDDDQEVPGMLPDSVPPVRPDAESSALPDADFAYSEQGLMAPAVTLSGWSRCIVDAGAGTKQMKLFFDHGSHSSGRQRGWVDCDLHDCRRYRHVSGTQAEFSAEMYAWFINSASDGIHDRWCHLAYHPPSADVAALVDKLRFTQF